MPAKIGRNEACPCGSGRKFKRCHGATNSTHDFPNEQPPQQLFYAASPTMLMNRVDREAKSIAIGFDELCHDHVAAIEEIYGSVSVLLLAGSDNADAHKDHLRQVLFTVLTNALKSITAAFSLLRMGWRLQPYQCIRNSMEGLSVTLHLFRNQEELEKFENDKLLSTKTIKSAKQLMPNFGNVYGILSEQFTHIGPPFRFIQKGEPYRKDESDLWRCLGAIMSTLWLAYQVSELVFLDSTVRPQFWKRVGDNQYQRQLDQQTKEWQSRLVSRFQDFIREAEAQ
jgi:hypothetical protein